MSVVIKAYALGHCIVGSPCHRRGHTRGASCSPRRRPPCAPRTPSPCYPRRQTSSRRSRSSSPPPRECRRTCTGETLWPGWSVQHSPQTDSSRAGSRHHAGGSSCMERALTRYDHLCSRLSELATNAWSAQEQSRALARKAKDATEEAEKQTRLHPVPSHPHNLPPRPRLVIRLLLASLAHTAQSGGSREAGGACTRVSHSLAARLDSTRSSERGQVGGGGRGGGIACIGDPDQGEGGGCFVIATAGSLTACRPTSDHASVVYLPGFLRSRPRRQCRTMLNRRRCRIGTVEDLFFLQRLGVKFCHVVSCAGAVPIINYCSETQSLSF